MDKKILIYSIATFIFCAIHLPSVNAEDGVNRDPNTAIKAELNEEKVEDDDRHSFLVGTLLYVPNRLLDIFDIFRLRVRVGPGIAAGARATKVAQAYVGTYATVYAGLPGPRLRSFPKSPIGLESHNGATISLVDATANGGIGPDYSSTEFGAGFQLGIVGFDFGVDPLEIIDFATGIITIDIREDDL